MNHYVTLLHRTAACFLTLLLASACGENSKIEKQSSDTLSLTGFPAGTVWPCQDYSHSLNENQRFCMQLPKAGSSHPAVDVLIELRGFSSKQTIKVKDAIKEFSRHWNTMRSENPSPNETSFGKCLARLADHDLFAVNSPYPAEHRSQEAAIGWGILNLQYMFEYHAQTKRPLIISAVNQEDIMGRAYLGADGYNSKDYGDIELSTVSLDLPEYSGLTFAGTLMHEWFHRKGYDHPDDSSATTYSTTLVVAAATCVRSNNSTALSLFDTMIIDD